MTKKTYIFMYLFFLFSSVLILILNIIDFFELSNFQIICYCFVALFSKYRLYKITGDKND